MNKGYLSNSLEDISKVYNEILESGRDIYKFIDHETNIKFLFLLPRGKDLVDLSLLEKYNKEDSESPFKIPLGKVHRKGFESVENLFEINDISNLFDLKGKGYVAIHHKVHF